MAKVPNGEETSKFQPAE